MAKQSNYNVGIYVRLSKDDERSGESLSIENQKEILNDYISKQDNWNLYDIYIDDGFSGTSFNRPEIQRLLDDAKTGKINLIICKDLSRFGRNYIEVGQYIDYIFPSYNIRFIALNDNIDTIDRNSSALEMMPIVNLFNEWHAASTSKKVRSVLANNAKQGKYIASFASYGYIKGNDKNHLPIIDHEAAAVVRRIFDMRATGLTPTQIARQLSAENVLIPSDYLAKKFGRDNPCYTTHFWNQNMVRRILENQIYIGNLAQQRFTTVSFKNHKLVRKDKEEWVVAENTHEPIIPIELWEKCREIDRSASRGKITKSGIILPLNGLMYCADCGTKIKQNGHSKNQRTGERNYFYTCGTYTRCGKVACSSHYISLRNIESIVLNDIRSLIDITISDEEDARKKFLARKQRNSTQQTSVCKEKLKSHKTRIAELDKLMQSIYEDKVQGDISASVCAKLLDKYESEQKNLISEVDEIESQLLNIKQDEKDVNDFIECLRKYENAEILTRQTCLELIDHITIDEFHKGKKERNIHIYYKFIDKGYSD